MNFQKKIVINILWENNLMMEILFLLIKMLKGNDQ